MVRGTTLVGRIAVCLLIAGSVLGVAEGSHLGDVKAAGRLVVASYTLGSSQFSRSDGKGGYDGFDIELMSTFAVSLGVNLEIYPVDGYGELIPAVVSGQADLVASSFTITAEREEVIDFSDSYFPILVQVVVLEGSDIVSFEDLQGRTGSVLPGSSQEKAMLEIGGMTPRHVESSADHWEALRSGQADFALTDSTSVIRDEIESSGTKVAFSLPGVTNYGIAFPMGSDLRQAFNEHLTFLKATSHFYRIVNRHFGADGLEMYELALGKERTGGEVE